MYQKNNSQTLFLPIGKYWLFFLIILVFTFSLAGFLIFLELNHFISIWLMLIGLPLCGFGPVLFFRIKINLFAKNADIQFTKEFFSFTESNNQIEKFEYSEIKYFNPSNYEGDNASIIKLIFRNSEKKRFIFLRQKNNDANVLNNVLSNFSIYNKGKMEDEKIQIAPSFFLTKSGKAFLFVTALIILIAIIFQLIYKPKATPASIFALLGSYIQAKSIQLGNKRIMEKFREQN